MRHFSQSIKLLINSILGATAELRLCSTKPQGRFLFDDLRKQLGSGSVVFDVGANRGSWFIECHHAFPRARYHCFEPMPEEYTALCKATCSFSNVLCWPIAFSSAVGESRLFLGSHSTTHSLFQQSPGQESVLVSTDTIDEFCSEHSITLIDLLKIDTEGNDLEVLRGAVEMLMNDRVSMILTEVCFDSNLTLPLFDSTRAFLEGFGYKFFGLYDQQPWWDGTPPVLYANACFISPRQSTRSGC